jgi:hypothetical protein
MLTVKPEMRQNPIDGYNHSQHGDDKACLWLRRLLVGLPSDQRSRRYLIVLQAFIDDSGRGKESDNPIFVLAGYAGSFKSFCDLADDWQAIMREEPALAYLKGKEANALDKNFKGWTEEQRDAKLDKMIASIRKHELIALSLVIKYRDFNRIPREPSGFFKNPFGITFAQMVAWLMNSAIVKREREEIELIFDEGVLARKKTIEDAYKGLKEALLSKDALDLLVGKPRFEDDRRYLPLQAADLLSWNVRRDCVEQLTTGKRWESPTWTALRTGIKGVALHFHEKELRDFKAGYLAVRQGRC